MKRLILFLLFWSGSALAFNTEFEAAGARLAATTSAEDRAVTLQEMAIAARGGSGKSGLFVAKVIDSEAFAAKAEAAADKLLELVSDPELTLTPKSFTSHVGPLLDLIGDAQDRGLFDLSMAIKLSKALVKLQDTAKALGFKNLEDSLKTYTGDSSAGARAMIALKSLIGLAQLVEGGEDLGRLHEDSLKRQQEALAGIVPGSLMPYAPIKPLFEHQLRWTGGLYRHSTASLSLVEEGIRTGQLDREALAKAQQDLKDHVRRGPWDNDTFREILTEMCKKVPPVNPFCASIFEELADFVFPQACAAIHCDCDNVQRFFYQQYRAQCLQIESRAREICAQNAGRGFCGFPHGPAAFPQRP